MAPGNQKEGIKCEMKVSFGGLMVKEKKEAKYKNEEYRINKIKLQKSEDIQIQLIKMT